MIELPESYVLADQINRTVAGRRITSAVAGHSPHAFAWYTGDPAEYDRKLSGKTITTADVFNGGVRIKADDMVLLISTPIRYHPPGPKRPAKHQLLIELDDGSALTCTVQMWGTMFCYRAGEEAAGIPVHHVVSPTPSPLENEFDRACFDRLVEAERPRNLPAKAFLATEQRIPGLGNGVLQDVLWTARVHPKRKMGTLSDAGLTALFRAVKTVLADMRDRGGRDTERDLFGRPGGYLTVLSRNTLDTPCPVCDTPIRREAYLGGAIYYCRGCQPEA